MSDHADDLMFQEIYKSINVDSLFYNTMNYRQEAIADAFFNTLTQSKQELNKMTQANTNNGTNVILKDVELHWAKLDKAVDPFGTLQWELQVQAPKSRTKELEQFGKVKALENGKVSLALKKKALKADGTDAAKVRVVDASKQPLDSKIIGNGSKGNVMVFQKPYEIKAPNGKVTKSGISTMLIAVQVKELVKYERKSDNYVDFDSEDTPVNVGIEEDEAMF